MTAYKAYRPDEVATEISAVHRSLTVRNSRPAVLDIGRFQPGSSRGDLSDSLIYFGHSWEADQ